MRKVYLDYAATTPVAPDVEKAMKPYWAKFFGNPMAMHSFGQEARKAVEEARGKLADFFGFEHDEIIFTSGATESNNLALRGVVNGIKTHIKRYPERILLPSKGSIQVSDLNRKILETKGSSRRPEPTQARSERSPKASDLQKFVPHIITTAFEHHCLLDSAKNLRKELDAPNHAVQGVAEVTFLTPTHDGLIKLQDILAAIKPNTVLVSVMYVNNEIGTVAFLKEISEVVEKERDKRKKKAEPLGKEGLPIYFHSDITQGVNYLPCNMKKLGVDLFSLSGHKIYGPKGVGALGVKKGTLIEKIQFGGEQEFNLRAGTHNVSGIVGMGAAISRITNYPASPAGRQLPITNKVRELRDYFWKKLQKEVPNISLNGSLEHRVANNLNISFAGVEGESMLLALDMAGVACSTGSACSSESLEPSHVLMAIGLTHPEAHGSLRFSLGEGTTKSDLDYAVAEIKKAVEKLRRVSGYKG